MERSCGSIEYVRFVENAVELLNRHQIGFVVLVAEKALCIGISITARAMNE